MSVIFDANTKIIKDANGNLTFIDAANSAGKTLSNISTGITQTLSGVLTESTLFLSPVRYLTSGTQVGSQQLPGNFTVGTEFYPTNECTIKGIRFYTAATGTVNQVARLWSGSIVMAQSFINTTGPGVYNALFTSSVLITGSAGVNRSFYASVYQTDAMNYTGQPSGSVPFSLTLPQQGGADLYWMSFSKKAAGNAAPLTNSGSVERFPVEPLVEGLTTGSTGGGGEGDWTASGGQMKTVDTVSIDGQNRFANAIGTDVNFYVSGTIGLSGSLAAKRAVMGGDLVVSGNIIVLGSTWQDVFDIDFTQEPNQTFGADGNFVIAGKTWTVSSKANSRTFDILNGTGLRIYPNTNASDYQNPSATSAPRIWIPLSSIVPSGVTFPTFGIRIWTYFATSGIDQNFERAFTGVEKLGSTTDYRVLIFNATNNGPPNPGVGAPTVMINNNISSVPPLANGVGTFTYGSNSNNVTLLQLTAASLNFRWGIWPGGNTWPTIAQLDPEDWLAQTLTSIQFPSGSGLALVLGSNNTTGYNNLTYDVKRIKVQIKEF